MGRLVRWAGALVLLGLAGFALVTDPAFFRLLRGASPAAPAGPADLANGRTLFFAGGCASCHASEGQPDRLLLGGGHAMVTPFGTFHVPNLSPHPVDGIGGWTVEQFIVAMREGVSPRGEHYFPAFPYTSYQRMGAKDLADLFAFLRTLTPVEGRVKPHEIGFPFNIRRSLGGWKLLFLDGRPFEIDPALDVHPTRDAAWNRGAYLVEGPGHCAECHSPRNLLGAIIEGRRYGGGVEPDGKKSVPNITPHPDGIGPWSRGEYAAFLKSGETPGFLKVGGSMGSVIRNMAELSEADRAAMAAYLTTLPPVPGKASVRP